MEFLASDQVNDLLQSLSPDGTVFLIGAGGCGMSGLGHLLLDLGHRVAGSDRSDGDEVDQLRRRGAAIQIGHDRLWFETVNPRLVIFSSAILPSSNPELAAALQKNIPVARRATVLSALLQRQCGVCVAGMHGKTTTSALLAFALRELQARPSYAIGALVPQLTAHASYSRLPEPAPAVGPRAQPFFVVEADESDGTLRQFAPEHAIVLNIDEEHLDYFGHFESVCREFGEFGRQTRGWLVLCADDARLMELFAGNPRVVSYGYSSTAQYRIDLEEGGERGMDGFTHFAVWKDGARLGRFGISLVGEKNIGNATAVIALLDRLGFGTLEIGEAIRSFRGAARRQQTIFRDERFHVIEDYGHHPTEIRATLSALRNLGSRRMLVAFQPHRFTRTKALFHEFASSFRTADRLWVTDIYPASEPPIAGVTGELLADAIRQCGSAAEFVPNPAALLRQMAQSIVPGDLVVFLGAGDITKTAQAFAADLRSHWSDPIQALYERLAARLSPETLLRRNEPLAKRTTLRVGGAADLYVEPASEDELSRVVRFCAEYHVPFTLLGRGSNLLIRDGGIRGIVICLAHREFARIELRDGRMHCGAGARLKTVSVEAKRNGISGFEFLEGIPGSIGGALRMNAGAMGGCMFDVVESVRYMDLAGNIHETPATELDVQYRQCALFKTHIALGATLKGTPGDPKMIAARMDVCSRKRWDSQPAAPSAGCIFKNPATIPAGKLIQELGLKGARVGGAVVSDVHGNFIVNDGTATAQDVLDLIEVIREQARTARGIELETEVEIIGSAPDAPENSSGIPASAATRAASAHESRLPASRSAAASTLGIGS